MSSRPSARRVWVFFTGPFARIDQRLTTPLMEASTTGRRAAVLLSATISGADKEVRVFRRIAIINRGEAAMRLIHAVQELNAEHEGGLRTIALHTEAERGAMFVREADEAECIGVPGTP